MGNKQKVADHSNKFTIKVILIAIFFVSLIVGLAVYIYTYPRTTIYLYNDEGIEQKKYEKYRGSTLRLSEVPEVYKKGHSFTYWTHDATGLSKVKDGISLDNDEYHFYGQFVKNTYVVTYYIQVLNEDGTDYIYTPFHSESVVYADKFTTPTGLDESTGQLTTLLSDRVGYTFNGWSTGVEYEESIANNEDISVFNAGQEYLYDHDINLNLYAIWTKDSYDVKLHTGIKYKTYTDEDIDTLVEGIDYLNFDDGDSITHYAIDSSGNYVIQNDTIDTVETSIKYLDSFQLSLEDYEEYTLASNTCIGAEEYDFKGWFLTNEFEANKTTKQALIVDVDPVSRVPYLKGNNGAKIIEATFVGNVDGVDKYEFDVYSKWVRRSYKVSLTDSKKQLTSSSIDYTLYKYDSLYGKLYDTDIHLRPIMNNYLGIDDEGNPIDGATALLRSDHSFTEAFTSLRYKFIGWNEASTHADYYSWGQTRETDAEFGLPIAYHTVYSNDIYRHTLSADTTLNASWAQQYEIVYCKTATRRYSSGIYAIIGETVYLNTYLDMETITNDAIGTGNQNATGALNIVNPSDNQEFKGWIPQSRYKNGNTPELFNDLGFAFYEITEADLSFSGSIYSCRFYTYFETIVTD